MSATLASLLFNDYRRRVLGLLLLHPDESYHVREIARLTGTVPGTLHKELSKLAEAGVLFKVKRGNQLAYQADRSCPIYEELASIVRKTSGLAYVLADTLKPMADNIDAAVVFGSVASGKESAGSDIDLLVVGKVDYAGLVKVLYPAQTVLGREINPKLYSPPEWRKASQEQSAFVREITEKPTINIIGSKDDLR